LYDNFGNEKNINVIISEAAGNEEAIKPKQTNKPNPKMLGKKCGGSPLERF
jgi:hypothetical protein